MAIRRTYQPHPALLSQAAYGAGYTGDTFGQEFGLQNRQLAQQYDLSRRGLDQQAQQAVLGANLSRTGQLTGIDADAATQARQFDFTGNQAALDRQLQDQQNQRQLQLAVAQANAQAIQAAQSRAAQLASAQMAQQGALQRQQLAGQQSQQQAVLQAQLGMQQAGYGANLQAQLAQFNSGLDLAEFNLQRDRQVQDAVNGATLGFSPLQQERLSQGYSFSEQQQPQVDKLLEQQQNIRRNLTNNIIGPSEAQRQMAAVVDQYQSIIPSHQEPPKFQYVTGPNGEIRTGYDGNPLLWSSDLRRGNVFDPAADAARTKAEIDKLKADAAQRKQTPAQPAPWSTPAAREKAAELAHKAAMEAARAPTGTFNAIEFQKIFKNIFDMITDSQQAAPQAAGSPVVYDGNRDSLQSGQSYIITKGGVRYLATWDGRQFVNEREL